MEIEKLSENKIKIILDKEELSIDTTKNIENIFSTQEFNKFFLSALNKAEKEIDFNTNGYKLLVELFYQNNKTYSLVVTKYLEADYLKAVAKELHNTNYMNKSQIKTENLTQINIFKTFNDFDNFLDFSNINNTKIKKEFKHFSLYKYNNKYYLITEKKNKAKDLNNKINSTLLEFSFPIKYTKNFEIKLQEHGEIIFYT